MSYDSKISQGMLIFHWIEIFLAGFVELLDMQLPLLFSLFPHLFYVLFVCVSFHLCILACVRVFLGKF